MNLPGTLADIDTEFLHDLRVAVRRTRSAIKLLSGVFPPEAVEHFKAEFKWLGDVTTPVRDLDVHLLGFDALTEQLAAPAEDLEPLRAFLVRAACPRVPAAGRGAARAAVPRHYRRLAQGAARAPRRGRPPAAASHRGRPGPRRHRQGVPAGRRAGRRDHLRLALRDPARPAQDAKELRYLLECFASLFPADVVSPIVRTSRASRTARRVPGQRGPGRPSCARSPRRCSTGRRGAPALMAMGDCSSSSSTAERSRPRGVRRRFAAFAGRQPACARPGDRRAEQVLATYNIKGGVGKTADGRQPRLPRRARGRADPRVGPRPAGRGVPSTSGSSRR